jgi:hypothetical protein
MFGDVVGERLTAGLTQVGPGGRSLEVLDALDDQPFLRLRPAADRTTAGLVDLVLLDGDRSVAVTFHPVAVEDVVRQRARRRGHDPNGWAAAVAGAVASAARRWGAWDRGGTDLTRALGGFGHPVLGEAYDAGAGTVGEVPRWASPALRSTTVAAAAADLFGPGAATRPVVRALAASLAQPAIDWWRLAVATAAARSGLVASDELAAALTTPPADEPAGVGEGVGEVPSAEDVRRCVAGLAAVGGAGRSGRLVRTSFGQPGGARRLVAVLGLLVDVAADVRRPVPLGLDDLERACLRTAAVDPGPRPAPAAPAAPARGPVRGRDDAPPPAPPAPPRPEPVRPPHTTPLRAPEVRGERPSADVELRHGPLARALGDGVHLDATTDLTLPRTPTELATWGRLLGNCLGSYATAVAHGASIVVGVRDRGALVAAFEVRGGRLTQVLGAGNRPAPRPLAGRVEAHVAAVLRGAVGDGRR